MREAVPVLRSVPDHRDSDQYGSRPEPLGGQVKLAESFPSDDGERNRGREQCEGEERDHPGKVSDCLAETLLRYCLRDETDFVKAFSTCYLERR